MDIAVLINIPVCVLGVIGAIWFAAASAISIANMTVPWRGALLVADLLVPVAFAVSGIGAWLAQSSGASGLAIGLIALPWVYGLAFVGAMLVTFKVGAGD
ncbi:MAG TPA: hypothetical protein VFS21_10280 [Roseiflexaceae bacterium]|nr:hypothetical protein [Roseiflexaceae bacterium]